MDWIAGLLRWIVGFGEVAYLSRKDVVEMGGIQGRNLRGVYLGNVSAEETIHCMMTTLSRDYLQHDGSASSIPPLTYMSAFTQSSPSTMTTLCFSIHPREEKSMYNCAFFVHHHLPSLDASTLPA